MAIASLEYPRLVPGDSKPPPHGPPPHAGENEGRDLDFFEESASDEDWSSRYNQWITAQAETRRSFNGLVAIIEREIFDNSHLFTLAPDTFINDNFLSYIVKSLKDKIGLTDPSVVFFSSFSFTILYPEGHANPTLDNVIQL